MQNKISKNLSLIIIGLFFIGFVYLTVKAIEVSSKTQMGVKNGIYTNKVSSAEQIAQQTYELTRNCEDALCKVQTILDYVTHIPYKINHFKAHSPQRTIQNNFGDCDDKSNLLISMLHTLEKEAYFVLVPKHIFVITPIEDVRLGKQKGLWLDGKKYYILESTAKGSRVGYPLRYKFDEIEAIIEPFSNEKVSYTTIAYKI